MRSIKRENSSWRRSCCARFTEEEAECKGKGGGDFLNIVDEETLLQDETRFRMRIVKLSEAFGRV